MRRLSVKKPENLFAFSSIREIESCKEWDPYDRDYTAAIDVWRAASLLLREPTIREGVELADLWRQRVRMRRVRRYIRLVGITVDTWVEVVWLGPTNFKRLVSQIAGVPAWDKGYYKKTVLPVWKRYEKWIQNYMVAVISGTRK